VAQKFLAVLDVELIEAQNFGPRTASAGRLPAEAMPPSAREPKSVPFPTLGPSAAQQMS
jgi:hypothetical protein